MPASPSTDVLIELIAPLIEHDGYIRTSLPSVTLMALRRPIPRTPLIYEPSLNIIAQGYKIGYLGDHEIHYGPGQYLVQTLPLPFECETHASPESPLLGVSIRLDPALLVELVTAMGERDVKDEESPVPMDSVSMTRGMHGAVVRLLQTLHDPFEIAAMGSQRERDVLFEALKGQQGAALRALVHHQGHYSQIVQLRGGGLDRSSGSPGQHESLGFSQALQAGHPGLSTAISQAAASDQGAATACSGSSQRESDCRGGRLSQRFPVQS